LQVHNPKLWKELRAVIAGIDAESCKTKVSKEKRTTGRVFYSPIGLNKAFRHSLQSRGWNQNRVNYWVAGDVKLIRQTLAKSPDEQKREILAAGETPIFSYNQTDFVKDRVAVEVQFGKYAFVAYDLFVKHLAFFVGDQIDVGVEILPMKRLQQEMSSGVPYFEGELYNVLRNGRGVPSVPLILIGITP